MPTVPVRALSARPSISITPRAAQLDQLPDSARLNPADVGSLLNIGQRTLRRWVAKGAAPAPVEDCPAPQWRAGDVRAYLNGGVQP